MTIAVDRAAAATADAKVDEIFATAHRELAAPGIAYGVVGGESILHTGGVGESSAGGPVPRQDSVFRIASMTKSFTAACVVLLRDEGVLALDDPVGRHIPQLAGLVLPTADSPPLTIRSLLTMSGGLPTDDPWADRQESMSVPDFDRLLEGGLTFVAAPDTGFEYSNLGFVILGRVVANVTGSSLREVVRSRLLEPLGMTSTCFAAADVPAAALVTGHHRHGDTWVAEPFSGPGEFAALGGLFSSVEDIATWMTGFAAAFPARDDPEDGHPLSRASRRAMQQQHRAVDPRVALSLTGDLVQLENGGYGYGLVVEHHPRWGVIVSHSGGYPGFGSHMRWHPGTGLGVVALANGRYARIYQPAAAALAAVLTAVHAPSRRVRPLPATTAARNTVRELLVAWDDARADELFASNVDLDQSRDDRRAAVAAAMVAVGGVSATDVGGEGNAGPVRADSAAHLAWTVPGAAGRLEVEVRLTPQRWPAVQMFTVSAVPDPSPTLAQAYRELSGALTATPASWPQGLRAGPDVDVAAVVRAAVAATALCGPLTVSATPTRSDGTTTAAWALTSDRATWQLSLAVGGEGVVTRCALTPVASGADDHVALELGMPAP
ncbi:MAG: serine hydrolase domain-containing protein [Candidatus Nanopelagicales bacterium]